MDDTDDKGRPKLARGLMWSMPLSIALWSVLALAVIAVIPHAVRHEFHTGVRYAAHALRHGLGWRTRAAGATRAG